MIVDSLFYFKFRTFTTWKVKQLGYNNYSEFFILVKTRPIKRITGLHIDIKHTLKYHYHIFIDK